MSRYLWTKYKGIYRVVADYDESTNDFPRDDEGNIDPSFDDFYIPCKNNIKIRHGIGNILSCYIPSKGIGMNILRQIYKDYINENLPQEKGTYLSNLCKQVVDKNILVTAEVLDGEVYFTFKSNMMDYIATLVKPKTSGKNISPLSVKNLPKTPYKIPDKDLKIYKNATNKLPKTQMGDRIITNGIIIKDINKDFDKIITEKLNINPTSDRKSKCLKGKEYIHSLGLWNEYCKFIEEYKYED